MSFTRRTVTILGSTGSIGTQALDIIERDAEAYQLRWITCNTRWQDLAAQVERYRPYGVAIRSEEACAAFRDAMPHFGGPVLCGEQGICDAAADAENSIVLSAMVGFSGVLPTMAAVRAGHIIGLANKESLVSAGSVIMPAVKQYGAQLLAVDSEHSAIAQCIVGEATDSVAKLIVTASGGPFRRTPLEELHAVTPAMALNHPNWTMGAKITIDSATLMNKGFEVMEAHWLFDMDASKIDVVVHPQSIIHSMVEFIDGSVKAQLGVPTMLVPIQYALAYPQRRPLSIQPLNLASIGSLTFEEPDLVRFPCLPLAYSVMRQGGSAGAVLNAANEVAVAAFLEGAVPFTAIPEIIDRTLNNIEHHSHPSLDTIVHVDEESRRSAITTIDQIRRIR